MTNVRALRPADTIAARALVQRQFSGSRYCARLLEQVDLAVAAKDSEYAGLLGVDENEAICGVALYGCVAGASGVLKIHALVGPAFSPLVSALIVSDAGDKARLFLCELPDDASSFARAAEALHEAGFIRESRVPGFFADDIALDILTRRGNSPTCEG